VTSNHWYKCTEHYSYTLFIIVIGILSVNKENKENVFLECIQIVHINDLLSNNETRTKIVIHRKQRVIYYISGGL